MAMPTMGWWPTLGSGLPFQTMSNLTSHREQSVPRVWYETQIIFHFKKEKKKKLRI
jgi:hypothetical protein